MGRGLKYSIIPAAAALAAIFLVVPVTGSDAVIEMITERDSFVFGPETLRIEPGQRIEFRNRTGSTHTAECIDCPWATGDVQPTDSRFVAFTEVGSFQFRCRYHPFSMTGVIGVGTDPIIPELPEPLPGDAPPIEFPGS